jgi:Ca2+-binding RTX toxin-like protein
MATIIGTLGNDTLIDLFNADDEIFGDSAGAVNAAVGDDRIFGRGGLDVIAGDALTIEPLGRGGNDLVQGGDGNDTIYGDARGSLFGVGGDDILYQNAGSPLFPTLVGDAATIEAGGRGGDDKLSGLGSLVGDSRGTMASSFGGDDLLDATGAGSGTVLHGDTSGDLAGNGSGGRDTLKGSAFRDALSGDAGDAVRDAGRGGGDSLRGLGGDDDLYGDAGDFLLGTATSGGDVLRGGAGRDVLYGDAPNLFDSSAGGDDQLYPGAGDDEMWGDGELQDGATGGDDTFNFSPGFGDDRILDFRLGEDQLVFRDTEQAEIQITLVGGGTVLTTLGDDLVALVGFGVDVIFA